MNKLLSVIVAALFAVSTTAFVASPAGAQTKDDKAKKEMKKGEGKKKAEGDKKAAAKGDKAAAKGDKAAAKKDGKKKDEMKK